MKKIKPIKTRQKPNQPNLSEFSAVGFILVLIGFSSLSYALSAVHVGAS
jgi:hypothetical protein